jgi:hypothetical protein
LITKSIVYYTCNTHKESIELACREQLLKSDLPIASVSLNKDIEFGNIRMNISGEKSPIMMHKQIIMGLENTKTDFVFLCESDVLYHPTHFKIPTNYYITYNTNVWKLWLDGLAVWTDDLRQVSGIVAPREDLLFWYRSKMNQINLSGFDRHFEPGVNQSVELQRTVVNQSSEFPNICIRHDDTLTKSKRSPEEFRNQKYAKGFKTTNYIDGWGSVEEIINRIT